LETALKTLLRGFKDGSPEGDGVADADAAAETGRADNGTHKTGQGRWTLTAQGSGLERTFKFKTFKKTWEFMDVVAQECKVAKHHPEWSNVRPHPPLPLNPASCFFSFFSPVQL